jgi:eukaryotic-like serine/threonine-protein kinase
MSETILNGRYALTAQQGSGGMSVIYRAVDRLLGRNVAIKVLRPSLTQDPTFLEKFRNEAISIANLSHPNIVTVFDVGSDGATSYIVMELVEGQDLKKIIKSAGAMPVERVVHLATQICAGIGFAHRSGIVHADIKPQNILVSPQDVVKVTDFGIAQALSDTQPQQRAEVVWGSPHYFSPEQARGEQPSAASDVYSIGIVMFEMLTGRLPYSGTNQQELAMAHIRDRIPNVNEFNPAVPESLATIVQKVMSKTPSDRYRMADQLGHVLQNVKEKASNPTISNPNVPPPLAEKPINVQPPVNPPQAPAQPPAQPASPFQRPGAAAYVPPQSTAEPTARFSPAPSAPQVYDPRQQAQNASPLKPVQSLDQRFTPPPPQFGQVQQPYNAQGYGQQPPRNFGDSGQLYPPQPSQPMYPVEEEQGTDWVTIALAVIAVIAVLGLIPVWLSAIAARL